MDTSPHKSDFVHVNGIRLHCLDWGGEGETLLFLTGMGCSAHLFDRIAPRFTDTFRVLALTRRGQAESDSPESGYDADTLVDDILKFMDALNIDKAILVGHSLAGLELSHFAVTYPERVTKLIYLDAAFDWRDLKTIEENDPRNAFEPPEMQKVFASVDEYIEMVKQMRPDLAQIWNESWDQSMFYELEQNPDGSFTEKDKTEISKAMMETAEKYEPKFSRMTLPVLSFFAKSEDPSFPSYLTDKQKAAALEYWKKAWVPWKEKQITNFRGAVPHASVIEIPSGHHYCFMAHEELVYREMRNFLLD